MMMLKGGRGGTMEDNEKVVDGEEQKTTMTFDEILASNKDYQSEFDKRLAKSNKTFLENEKVNWEKEFTERLEREKSEAQKLAEMNTEQRLQYKIDQLEAQIKESNSKLNASQLKDETANIFNEKGIPSSYLNMFDFSKETADTINSKVEMLVNIRSKDLEDSLNRTLRQDPPKHVDSDDYEELDPYVEGFRSEL